jgi:hypothetical protein
MMEIVLVFRLVGWGPILDPALMVGNGGSCPLYPSSSVVVGCDLRLRLRFLPGPMVILGCWWE